MDSVDFLFQRAQQAYAAFAANPTAELGQAAHDALMALNEEVETRIALLLKAGS